MVKAVIMWLNAPLVPGRGPFVPRCWSLSICEPGWISGKKIERCQVIWVNKVHCRIVRSLTGLSFLNWIQNIRLKTDRWSILYSDQVWRKNIKCICSDSGLGLNSFMSWARKVRYRLTRWKFSCLLQSRCFATFTHVIAFTKPLYPGNLYKPFVSCKPLQHPLYPGNLYKTLCIYADFYSGRFRTSAEITISLAHCWIPSECLIGKSTIAKIGKLKVQVIQS